MLHQLRLKFWIVNYLRCACECCRKIFVTTHCVFRYIDLNCTFDLLQLRYSSFKCFQICKFYLFFIFIIQFIIENIIKQANMLILSK